MAYLDHSFSVEHVDLKPLCITVGFRGPDICQGDSTIYCKVGSISTYWVKVVKNASFVKYYVYKSIKIYYIC